MVSCFVYSVYKIRHRTTSGGHSPSYPYFRDPLATVLIGLLSGSPTCMCVYVCVFVIVYMCMCPCPCVSLSVCVSMSVRICFSMPVAISFVLLLELMASVPVLFQCIATKFQD